MVCVRGGRREGSKPCCHALFGVGSTWGRFVEILEIMKTVCFVYHVIMGDPVKARGVMAVTAMVESRKIIILFVFAVTIFD
jgi:biotin synthase-related radical SAM superfamily protein